MMRTVFLLAVVLLTACVPTNNVTPLAPQTLKAPGAPRAALQAAVRTLTLAGYDMVVSDVDGGVVAARKTANAETMRAQIICKYGQNSLGESMALVTHNVTVSAKDAADGVDVVITPRVVTAVDPSAPPAFRKPANEKDCVSTGAMEREIAQAIQQR